MKTRDIQAAFAEWENANGGFKIKWIDDTSLLIVFADATVGAYFVIQAHVTVIYHSVMSNGLMLTIVASVSHRRVHAR